VYTATVTCRHVENTWQATRQIQYCEFRMMYFKTYLLLEHSTLSTSSKLKIRCGTWKKEPCKNSSLYLIYIFLYHMPYKRTIKCLPPSTVPQLFTVLLFQSSGHYEHTSKKLTNNLHYFNWWNTKIPSLTFLYKISEKYMWHYHIPQIPKGHPSQFFQPIFSQLSYKSIKSTNTCIYFDFNDTPYR
jgi:hypothetical protein